MNGKYEYFNNNSYEINYKDSSFKQSLPSANKLNSDSNRCQPKPSEQASTINSDNDELNIGSLLKIVFTGLGS